METFAEPRPLVDSPHFEADRERALRELVLDDIDAPIRGIVEGFSKIPYCYTLQSCFGHFVRAGAEAEDNLERLPSHDIGPVTYRIAYVALCVQANASGEQLLAALAEVPSIEPAYVQFGSPGWFWERQVNSFALQVEPKRFAHLDQAVLDHAEALQVQQVRDLFYASLSEVIESLR